MLELFRGSRSGKFFHLRRPLSQLAVRDAFRQSAKGIKGQALFRIVREIRPVDGVDAHVSLLIYKTEHEPVFLKNSQAIDRAHGFLLLIETNEILAIYKQLAADPSPALSRFTRPVNHDTLTKIFGSTDSAYEELAIQSMTVSEHSIRSKSVAADDLKHSLNRLLLSRSIPKRAKYREGSETFVVAPASSKISKIDQRVGLDDLVRWSRLVASEINTPRTHVSFLDGFARAISLEDLGADVAPAGLLLLTDGLEADIESGEIAHITFSRPGSATSRRLTPERQQRLIRRLKRAFSIHKDDDDRYAIKEPGRDSPTGYLKWNPRSFTLTSPLLAGTSLVTRAGEVVPLQRYLNLRRDFLISFDSPNYVYFRRQLYEDRQIAQMARSLLSIFDDSLNFTSAVSEKGTFNSTQTAFTGDSVFHVVENGMVGTNDICICDDLGNEWADYIILSSTVNPPYLTFCHAKHGDVGLSASDFQDVVGQALKNLGNMAVTSARFAEKIAGWDAEKYKSSTGVATNIARIRKGSTQTAIDAYKVLQANPNCVRRACVVVSFISKQEFATQVGRLESGDSVRPNVVQLIWILSAFVSTCIEANIQPHLYSRA